jgi:hypothetical protein
MPPEKWKMCGEPDQQALWVASNKMLQVLRCVERYDDKLEHLSE